MRKLQTKVTFTTPSGERFVYLTGSASVVNGVIADEFGRTLAYRRGNSNHYLLSLEFWLTFNGTVFGHDQEFGSVSFKPVIAEV